MPRFSSTLYRDPLFIDIHGWFHYSFLEKSDVLSFLGNGLANRDSREKWRKSGSPDDRERAHNIARELLDESKTEYISKDTDQKISEKLNIFLLVP